MVAEQCCTVSYLKAIRFSSLSLNQKLSIKKAERPYSFSKNVTAEKISILACSTVLFTTKLFTAVRVRCCQCFVLLSFPAVRKKHHLARKGVRDLKHLAEKLTKHEKSITHMSNSVDLTMVGNANIVKEICSGYSLSIVKHNERVMKNKDALSKIIDCWKFCQNFELPLRGHDNSAKSENPGIFLGLVNFSCSLDSSLDAHLRSATAFKGTSKTIPNELQDSILQVRKGQIRDEVKNSEYLVIISDETTDFFCKTQQIIVLQNPLNTFENLKSN